MRSLTPLHARESVLRGVSAVRALAPHNLRYV